MARLRTPDDLVQNGMPYHGMIRRKLGDLWVVSTSGTPSNYRNNRTLAPQAIAQFLLLRWRTLTWEEQDSWRAYKLWHDLYDWLGNWHSYPSHMAYLHCNAYRLQMALSPCDTWLWEDDPGAVQNFALAPGTLEITASWTPEAPLSFACQLSISGPQSPGRRPDFSKSRVHSFTPSENGTLTFPVACPGTYAVHARHIRISDGNPGPLAQSATSVV